ncbi:MAG: protein kinase [Planctomycetes bacterium]|nr:protein kinase [Planctomycetota bacterium]
MTRDRNVDPDRIAPDGDENGVLDGLLAEYVDRMQSGEILLKEEILRDHPDIGSELLRKLQVFQDIGFQADGEPLGTLGDYTLRRQIGRGGMGVVYEAWENSMDRRVALKVMPKAVAVDTRAVARFIQEAQLAGKLSHPNIVHIHGMGVKEQIPYYAMDFVEGETLAQIVAKIKESESDAETPFGKKDDVRYFANIAEVFAAVADGLQHAHSKKIIHRDIKPSNLILDGEGRLRILDFGLAHLEGQESLTQSGDFLGTPQYMSPEQARRKKIPVDHRTDVYSLGATLYEMITSRPPFQGKDHQDTLSQIIERDPSLPSRINPRVPRDLETIVLKCLRKDPADRYGTAEAVAQDLRRFVRGEVVEARRESSWEVFRCRVKRHRVGIAVGVLAVLLVVVTGLQFAAVNRSRHAERWARYQALVEKGLDALEVDILVRSGDPRDGETLSLGLVDLEESHQGRGGEIGGFTAVERFREAAGTCPEHPEAFVHLSRALRAVDRRGESRRSLRDALSRDAGFVPALLLEAHALREDRQDVEADALVKGLSLVIEKGWRRLWLDAHLAACSGDWERVDRLYTALLAIDEPDIAGFKKELHLKRGRVRLRRGLALAALQDFHHVREASGGAVGPTLLLATAYYVMDARDEAAALLDEVVARNPGDADLGAIVDLYRRFGEWERARRAVGSLRGPCERLRGQIKVTGDSTCIVELAEEALSAGCEDPFFDTELAEALVWIGRQEDALNHLRRALEKHPLERTLIHELLRVLFIVCNLDELIELADSLADSARYATTVGFAFLHKADLEAARERFDVALEHSPRDFVAFFGRSAAHYESGDRAAALDDALEHARLGPHWDSHWLLRRIYTAENRDLYTARWEKIEAACAEAARNVSTRSLPRFLGFRALAVLYREKSDPELALRLARESMERGAERGPHWLSETRSYLGEVHFARGEHAEAVRAVESAVALPQCWRSTAEDLARYRRQVFPALLSCASVDAFLAGDLHEDGGPLDVLSRVRSALDPRSVAARYLEARLAADAGRPEEAAKALAALIASGMSEAAAVLRLAELHVVLGRREQALALIENRFTLETDHVIAPWTLWMRLSSATPSLPLAALTDRLAALGVSSEDGGKPDARQATLGELVRALRALATDGVLRIDCGSGRDFVDAEGHRWQRDAFFTGGWGGGFFRPPIHPATNRELYYTLRSFEEKNWARNGYEIPLPAGRYELVVHFCQPTSRFVPCGFEIHVEGRPVGDRIEPAIDPGVGVTFEVRTEVNVNDGALDIELVSIRGTGVVNAIEVRPLAAPESGR